MTRDDGMLVLRCPNIYSYTNDKTLSLAWKQTNCKKVLTVGIGIINIIMLLYIIIYNTL